MGGTRLKRLTLLPLPVFQLVAPTPLQPAEVDVEALTLSEYAACPLFLPAREAQQPLPRALTASPPFWPASTQTRCGKWRDSNRRELTGMEPNNSVGLHPAMRI